MSAADLYVARPRSFEAVLMAVLLAHEYWIEEVVKQLDACMVGEGKREWPVASGSEPPGRRI
jgi:hypothetical protein